MEGKLYYKDGSLRFEGTYTRDKHGRERYVEGKVYRKDGTLWMEGHFQRGGLRSGKEYYPSGQLMFFGEYIDRESPETGGYYGPPYPTRGKFYSEDGKLIYRSAVRHTVHGSLGYPYIQTPDGEIPVHGLNDHHFKE